MEKRSPNLFDRLRVKSWPDGTKAAKLREHALSGNSEWVLKLLEETDYSLYPLLFDRDWWVSDLEESEWEGRLEIARSVLRFLLERIDRRALPSEVESKLPREEAETNIAFLHLYHYEKVRIKERKRSE